MEPPPSTPPLPADYCRKHAARVRALAAAATTLALKEHLHEVARQYDGLAERQTMPPAQDLPLSHQPGCDGLGA
jgi:hypothetical protein